MVVLKGKRQKLASRATKCIFLGYGTDGQFRYCLWEPKLQRLVRSSDAVFNEDNICRAKVQPKSGKPVSFDLTAANPEDHAKESQGNTDNMSRTTLEDYKEVTSSVANLPVTSLIPVSRGSTSTTGLDVRESYEQLPTTPQLVDQRIPAN